MAKKVCKLSALALMCLGVGLPVGEAVAAVVSGNVNYQTYLDFARNRGQFKVGATGIEIFDIYGQSLGKLEAPMPDWSPVSTTGYATLVAPQYIVSVRHNGSYTSVSFGDGSNSYQLVDRNNSGVDFHTPRLNKIVTEAAALDHIDGLVTSLRDRNFWAKNSARYTAFYRIGSGVQQVKTSGGNQWVDGAYSYLTGGTVKNLFGYSNGNFFSSYTTALTQQQNGLLPSYGLSGDSGSPLLAYDSLAKKWVIVGVLTSGGSGGTNWATMNDQFLDQSIQEDTDAPLYLNGGSATWTYDAESGQGHLNETLMHGQLGNDLNAGKHLAIYGGGHIDLANTVNQGAGVLTLNGQYTVTTDNGSTWKGGGIILGTGSTVTWAVNGVKGDNLHLIGQGTFIQQGVGVNEGGLKVGQGTVILRQKADENGLVKAFSSININSGRATVILGDDKQIDPDTVTWGYRGGTLDVNGHSLIFHKLNHADSGAILANNNAQQTATITLDYATKPEDIQIKTWEWSKKGNVGDVYCGGAGGCWVLKTANYGYFPAEGVSTSTWQWMGKGPQAQEEGRLYGAGLRNNFLFHGQFQGNMNIVNKLDSRVTQPMVIDGSVHITGRFEQENGRLTFQGHPETHAYVQQWQSEGLAGMGSQGVFYTPTTLDQSDWETRNFVMAQLSLKDTDFGLGRNANLFTHIVADHATVTLGDTRLFVDLYDGNGLSHTLSAGHSNTTPDSALAYFQGTLTATNQSTVNLQGKFVGSLAVQDSHVKMASRYLSFDDVALQGSTLRVESGSIVGVNHSWQSDVPVRIDDSQFLLQAGATQSAIDHLNASLVGASTSLANDLIERATTVGAGYYRAPSWQLLGQTASMEVGAHAVLDGDVTMDHQGTLTFGGQAKLNRPTTSEETETVNRLNGYAHSWRGGLTGEWGQAQLQDTAWLMTKNSSIQTLQLQRSLVSWRHGDDAASAWSLQDPRGLKVEGFNTLSVTGDLTMTDSSLMMRTNLTDGDTLKVHGALKGQNNALYVTYTTEQGANDGLNVKLIEANGPVSEDFFKPGVSLVGFTRVTPVFEVQNSENGSSVVLTGFKTAGNQRSLSAGQDVLNKNYQGFISEINNMNLRMGELRDNPFGAGAWVRVTQAAGSSDTSNNDWTAVQMGSDRQLRHATGSTYVGALLTYTHSTMDSDLYNGQGDAYGVGAYASTVWDSGLYVDAIAKYIRANNDYQLHYAGVAQQSSRNNIFYAGAEVGYRLPVAASMFVEPQAELVLGHMGQQSLSWKNETTTLSMQQDQSTPLIGRTGVVFGKHFEGASWKLDARLGAHYEFDITTMGDMTLTDGAKAYSSRPERDGRLIYALGVNAQIQEHLRLGLELQRSAFGQYNLDHYINATARYSF